MPDASDSDSPSDSSSSDDSREGYVQQWNALCEELGTSDPNEVLARVQTLKRQMERVGEQEHSGEGLVTISEVEEVFREMNEKIEKLRQRNSALARRLEEEEEGDDGFHEFHQKTERLIESLGATTVEEAHERIRHLHRRLEHLYQEKEHLVQAGLSDAEEAIEEIHRLQEERDQLRQKLEDTTEDASRTADPDTSVLEAAVVIRDRIGVSSPSEAETFTQIARDLYERVQARARAHGVETEDTPDNVVEMLHSMAAQIDALPASDALPQAAAEALGAETSSEARTLANTARRIGQRILEHYDASIEVESVDPASDDTLSLLHTLEDQLQALPPPTASANGEGLPPEAGDILGIHTVEDARELEALIDDMSSRLERLQEEHAKLDEAGLSVDGALTMIENMEAQLVDLYHRSDPDRNEDGEAGLEAMEAEALIESMEAQLNDLYRQKEEQRKAADRLAAIEDVLGVTTREEAEELSTIARQMEEQLTILYQEKEKLHDLGLSSIGDAVDMIESLNAQLDDLYTARDAEASPEERHEAWLWAPETPSASPSSTAAAPAKDDSSEKDTLTMNSMEHQLEALYREKETLLHHGFSSAEEAVTRLQTQQRQIDALQRENHTYEQRFDRLKSELGTERVPQIVEVVRALEAEADRPLDALRLEPSSPAESMNYGVDIEATSPFVAPETLDRLDDMCADELDALDVGAVRLSEDGTVEALNDAALQLPGLQSVEDRTEVVGKNFFLDLAPSTNNNLFFGRFRKGQRRGKMDARFPYTFTSPKEGPQSFAVHLYRSPDSRATWLLFRPT